jgi:hypothetical protein
MTHTKDEAQPATEESSATQPVQEPVECQYGNGGYACCEGGPCKADEQNNAAQPVQEPVAWIDCKVQMPPPGVRVFFLHKDYDRVGFDTWFGDDFLWTPSHWMPIPPLTATPPAQPAPVQEPGGLAGQGRELHRQLLEAGRELLRSASEPEKWGSVGPFPTEIAWDKFLSLASHVCTGIDSPPAAQQEHEPENEPFVSLASVQEPVSMDAIYGAWHGAGVDIAGGNWSRFVGMLPPLYTTTPAQPAVPDAIGPNEDELPAYAAGWNDCRAEMLKGME